MSRVCSAPPLQAKESRPGRLRRWSGATHGATIATLDDHTRTNLAHWESLVPVHTGVQGYDLRRFDDPAALSDVVTFDAPHLGDLSGKRVLHLQCHIGTDTLSLARLGGEVTGVDFSPSALAVARDLANRAGPPVRFVESSVDDAPTRLAETFDVIYTGVGALNWLPSVGRWAVVVATMLSPGGRLYLREFHPILNALDNERDDRLLVVEHPYFETDEPIRWETPLSYIRSDEPVAQPVTYEWNHGLGEVVQAVIDAGLSIARLEEHPEAETRFFDWMVPTDRGGFVLPERPERLPLMFTVEATKDS